MEKTYKISGRLIDKNKKPLDNLKVKALRSFFLRDDELGYNLTDTCGAFEIIYSADYPDSSPNNIKLEISIENELITTISSNNNIEGDGLEFKSIIIDVNIGIEGRITDEHGDPVPGLLVAAEDVDLEKMELHSLNLIGSKIKSFIKEEGILDNSIGFIKDQYNLLFPFGDNFLGNAVTDENGYYRIIYPPEKYKKIANKDPNIQIIVKDKLGIFELRRTAVYENVKDVIKQIDKIIINRAEIEGWFVTLKSQFKSRLTENNDFEILIDNQKALQKIANVIEEAESYIYLTQFEFDSDFIPQFSSLDKEKFKDEDTLAYKLLRAQNKDVAVKIIINENAIIPDNYRELRNYFKGSKVEVRNFPAKGPYAMHAKVLVADGKKAFIIGSPFSQSYWDTDKHLINDHRRLNKGPLHDVSIYLEGNVIHHIEEFFIELWNYLSDQCLNGECKISNDIHFKKLETIPNSQGHEVKSSKTSSNNNSSLKMENQTIQIVRSITPGTINKGERGILEAYRKAITNARDFIYLENQYFTNKYIIGALKEALENNPDLQLIMLLNEVPDVPTYRSWQNYGLEFIGLDLQRNVLEHPQIGAYTKWSCKFEDENKIKNCYIHSKVAIVDDIWATIGTANLDGSSLSCAEEFGNHEISANHLNMEMNALFFDFEQKNGTIENFRKHLWSEHLEIDMSDLKRPKEGWLNSWNKIARDNLKKLENGKFTLNGGILPYGEKLKLKGLYKI
ncbi:phospholipase D-like domain-containing protein [Methanobacterium sp.]|uniref:phospholipase D-like domain-containing protein n=1 Tax=Methanobacterium sp. TaxID=2164 RepID=UPI003C76C20E